MTCPSCSQRKGRRKCPALDQHICPICCGTKRLIEIQCPDTCSYLAVAREHPAAVVKRQRDRDVAALLPSISHLTERQYQIFFLVQTLVSRHKPEGFSRLLDDDVAQAAGAVAATLETAGRGVLYEHSPATVPAQRLAREITSMLAEIRTQGAKIYDGEVAIALRAVERGAQDTHKAEADEDAYITLMGRLLHAQTDRGQPSDSPASPAGSLIVP